MEKLTWNQMARLEGGRFLGWGWKKYTEKPGSRYIDAQGCLNWTDVQSYTVFGLDSGISREKPQKVC